MTEPCHCESFQLAAMAHADNEPAELSEQEVRQHLVECVECRLALDQLTAVADHFRGVERQSQPIDVWPRVSSEIAEAAQKVDQGVSGRQPAVGPAKPGSRRWLPMVLVVGLMLGLATWLWQTSASAGPTLGQVVENLQQTGSLKLQVTRNGISQQVLVQGRDSLRWVESEDRYQIARGDRLWRVDARVGRFHLDTATYFDDDGLNLFELLGITAELESAFSRKPVAGGRFSDFVYEFPARRGSQDVTVEAVVFRGTERLRSLRVLSVEEDETTSPVEFCRLAVESFDEPLDESLFIVAKSLTEDFRIGKIVDSDGVVTVKPVMNDRWTPVFREMVLKRGDWIRTDARGPNAVAVRVANARLTIGPGSLLELIDAGRARLHRGEVQVEVDRKKSIELIAGKAEARQVTGRKLLRLAGDGFQVLTNTPDWLAGFEGTQSDESLGSLIAEVDGRSVPLTVGYHKVTVEIRDQIARTTIEESFVNRTNSRLEGQFYFPLPQDASISGFGMWIGNELVEADVVEKQRAREIFETILREKRDPGLLEWTGGNIFKARVFPIFPHSEKRIKITYTQVLPLRGNKYRYTYGLRSELLRQFPLRDLSIDLKIYSESTLRKVECPSHSARIDQTDHSGHIEFSAQEYSPDADFEAVIEIDGRSSDVVVVPHQRGDDGYFMLQLMPPGRDGNWQRELVPDGEPLKLLILADTSSSMDSTHRRTQAEFIASLLMSLGPKDQFNLAACDVECDWVFEESQDAGKPTDPIEAAQQFLASRVSLGWTDLDRAFHSVLERADGKTHVVYVGDGVVTAGSADPDEFVNRLQRLTSDCQSTFHAITVGSSYETAVLKSIAAVGGGSFRRVNVEQGPQEIARELLSEITQPGLTDLNVEIRGLRVARMYPEELPNIAAGTQHIIIGRYLPQGRDQRGEVIVTGKRGDDTIRYRTRFTLNDAEKGNSFIPRLWARAHLDHLLSQGRSAQIQDEVVALSEEYHIMTPYTSLLVLESDADRERFKVKRRVLMRDGERFFAEGRRKASYELLQKQMKLAGLWRANLRAQILRSFSGMGRNAAWLNPWQVAQQMEYGNTKYGKDSGFGDYGWNQSRGDVEKLTKDLERSREERDLDDYDDDSVPDRPTDPSEFPLNPDDVDGKPAADVVSEAEMEEPPAVSLSPQMQAEVGESAPGSDSTSGRPDSTLSSYLPSGTSGFGQPHRFVFDGFDMLPVAGSGPGRTAVAPQSSAWLLNLFPQVSPVRPISRESSSWSKEAIELSDTLLRTESLDSVDGLEINRHSTTCNPRWDRVSSVDSHRFLYSKERWLNYSTTPGTHIHVDFCDARERGVYSRPALLGQIRRSEPSDRLRPNLPASDHSLRPLYESYAHMTAKVEDAGENRKRLRLSQVDSGYRMLIDTQRSVILEIEEVRNGRTNSRIVFSDFKMVAGRPWASKIVTYQNIDDGPVAEAGITGEPTLHRISETHLEFKVLAEAAFRKRFGRLLADRSRVQFLQIPLPTVEVAREARAAGRAGFDEHLILADYFHASGQWSRVEEHLTAMETLAGDKPGLWFLRNALLREMDRESMRVRILKRAREVAAKPGPEDFYLAGFLFGQMQQITAYNEQSELLDILKPVYDRQPDSVEAGRAWINAKASVLRGLGRNDLVLQMRRQMAVDFPWDASSQTAYAYALVSDGQDYESAVGWLRRVLADHQEKWTTAQDESLRNVISGFLESQGRYKELLEHTRAWAERNPASYNVHSRLLTALVWNDRLDEAEATMLKWMKEGVSVVTDEDFDTIRSFQPPVEKRLTQSVANRLNAALGMAMGQGYNLYTHRIEPKWLGPLAKVTFAFARQRIHRDYASRIVSHGQFASSDEARFVRQQAFEVLREELATLPVHELQTFLRWSLNSTARIDKDEWIAIADRLEERWESESTDSGKHQLGSVLMTVLSSRLDMARRLAFLRRQIQDGGSDYRQGYISSLFHLLLSQPSWKEAFEVEAFSWLPKLHEGQIGSRMAVILPALYRLSDRMISQRYQTALKNVDPETKANRIAYRRKKYELYRTARAGYRKRLGEVMTESEDWLAEWMKIEHIYLMIRQGEDLKQQAKVVREFLGAAPPKPELEVSIDAQPNREAKRDASPEQKIRADVARQERLQTQQDEWTQKFYSGVLRHRYVLTAAHLATRRSTTKIIADALLKYIDAGIAMNPAPADRKPSGTEPVNLRKRIPKPEPGLTAHQRNVSWKSARYRMLIALDRPRELQRDLLTWIRKDRQTAPWRLSLARLLAEQGRLEEAVRLYRAVEHTDELRPAEYRSLADWSLALDRRDDYEQARFMYYATMPEGRLNQLLNQQIRRYQATDGTAPATLDTEILLMVKALMEKSAYPANFLYQIRNLYTTTKDFRLFRSVPIAALGQTAGHAYNMVSNCQSAFTAVMEEATVDEIVELLRDTRAQAESDTDRRALDLLEVVAERRAIELQNQAGPHVRPAVAALKRAFEHEWADGEQAMMMSFLSSLGRMPQQELAAEQRRQMKQLYARAPTGTLERLQMAGFYAGILWDYGQQMEALVELEAAIAEFDESSGKKWPQQANGLLDNYLGKLQQKGRYADVESILLDHLTRPRNAVQKTYFENRLDRLYYDALANGAQVSLGTGQVLYRACLSRLLARLDSADDATAHQLVTKILELLNHARLLKWEGAADDFRSFADQRIPKLLRRATSHYRNILSAVGIRVKEFFGATEAIRYLLDRIDQDPPRFRYRSDDAWSQHAGTLAGWLYSINHTEKKTLPKDLDARLLKFALSELRRDLESHQQRGRYFYGHNYGYFWQAHHAEFVREAEMVLMNRERSGDSAAYIAAYLYGIKEYQRGIEIMLAAHRDGLLNDGQIDTLVSYLQTHDRFEESVPLVEGLVERLPDSLGYRVNLIQAYFRVDRAKDMMALLDSTDVHFRRENRWTESAMAQLADVCGRCELWDRCAAYYSDAIMERRRTSPMTAAGDGVLSSYYSYQSHAFVQLGKTREAVDAAASGIVCWGRNESARNSAVLALVNVFRQIEDRDSYAKFLDAEAGRTQQDRPIVRRALGLAYQQEGEYGKAVEQLKIAVQLQPDDAATHTALIDCYDRLEDREAAIAATLAFLNVDRRNVETFAKLGERFRSDAAQQERAFTGMVEMKPYEADSHARLAGIRESQKRWSDAIRHWQQVVRIRSLEPTGLYGLIQAQIQAKRFDDARRSIRRLEQTAWPQRFGSVTSRVERFRRDISSHLEKSDRSANP